MRHGYSIDEMAAMGTARGVSYGVIQQCLEHRLPLPPLRRSVRWPEDSEHHGEDELPEDPVPHRVKPIGVSITNLLPPPVSRLGSGVMMVECSRCGERVSSIDAVKINRKTGEVKTELGLRFTSICTRCAHDVLVPKFKKPRLEDRIFMDGKPVSLQHTAVCSECGRSSLKSEGSRIYVQPPGEVHPRLRQHICDDCWPAWARELQKNILTAGFPGSEDASH